MDTRSFIEVMALLREGFIARREDWKDQYLFLAGGGRIEGGKSVRTTSTKNEDAPCVFLLGGPEPELPVLAVLCLRTTNGIIIGWSANADDLAAIDWYAKPKPS